jgi:acyl-coenzyme A thioesterase PaaI-like protein
MENKTFKRFKRLITLLNFYPPYFFAGIKIIERNEDFTFFKVRLKLTWYNRNLVGTAFGGSLYSMCDPFFMFILFVNLGEEYIVWDKAASIDFVKPGKGTVFASFQLSQAQISEVKSEVDRVGKGVFKFPCEVIDQHGQTIARLEKAVYVRRKKGPTNGN